MINNIKQTLKHSSIFALGKISTKLVGFILLPIYTKEISVSDYGILGILELIDLLGSNVLSIGMPQALLRWYTLAENKIEKQKIVFTNFIFLVFIFCSATLMIIPFQTTLSTILFDQSNLGIYLVFVFISVTLSNLGHIPQSILRMEEKSLFFSISITVQFTISMILNIYFVAVLKLGVRGILIANIISNGLLFMVLLPYLLKRMEFELDFKKLKEMLLFSYPFILIALSTSILSLGDRYILTKLTNLSQVGLYSLGYKISNVLKIFVVDSFTLGLPIIGWQVVKANSKPNLYLSRVLTYLTYILCWLGLAIAIFSKEIIQIFAVNKDYWDAYQVIPYLLLGVLFLGVQQHLFFIMQIPKKTKQISYIIGSAAILNIFLNLILIPNFQMLGAAYATIVSYLVVAILAYVAVKKYYPVKFEIKRMLLLITLSIILFIISTLDINLSGLFNLIFKASIIIAFPLLLALVNFYSAEEKKKIKNTIKYLRYKNRS
ncbi:MAG: hypothetical protein A2Y94_02335 [Caldithrix sp. RBG_13_44_9]|nr:MAG: hypothetical protein A2Y94_02335 [Caldithrix sp. RBG_13_44_9]